MGESFASRLRRTLDHATGIVEYHFSRCHLQNGEDVHAFFTAMADNLLEVPKPRDVVVCLDELIVAPPARALYGEERAKLAKEYYRYSARYAGTTATKIATMTSAVRYRAEGLVYETRDEAFKAILDMRAASS
jgi:hypothetical protein